MRSKTKLEILCDRISEHVGCVSDVSDFDFRKSLLDWQCIHGHIFTSSAHSVQGRMLFHIRSGAEATSESMCPVCIKQRVAREASEKSAQYLNECKQWGLTAGIKCLSTEVPKTGVQVQWQCEYGHEWAMTLEMAKSWGGANVCPVCNDHSELYGEQQSLQKAVMGTVAHRLREEGFNLSSIADAMGRRPYELAYCFERYSPDLVRYELSDGEIQKYAIYVESIHKRIHCQLKAIAPKLTDDEVIKCSACLVALELMRVNATMKEIKESFGDNYKQVDYWLSVIFPRYKNINDLMADERIIKHMNDLLVKSKHLLIDVEDPFSDMEKLKRTDHFRIAVICLLKKHEATGLVTKADILKRFKVTYKTLEMWAKRINHKINVGQIILTEDIVKIQAAIENELLENAA